MKTASTSRRPQRFFQHVELDTDWALPLLIRLLRLRGSWLLVLDRTSWQIGRTEVNTLVLAVVGALAGARRHAVQWDQTDAADAEGGSRTAVMQPEMRFASVRTELRTAQC